MSTNSIERLRPTWMLMASSHGASLRRSRLVMAPRTQRVAALSIVVAFVVATWAALEISNARANGGETISAAPQLPLNQSTPSGYGKTGREYWRVEMPAGALLTFDGTVTSTCEDGNHAEAYIYVFPPSTTDFTRRETPGVTDTSLNPNGELRFTAPYSGNWLLEVEGGCGYLAYSFTAKVQDPTHASLTAPHSVRRGKSFAVEGSIMGAIEGSVVIQLLRHHRWITLAPNVPLHGGTFRWETHVSHRGREVFRVNYDGDSGHLPTSAQHVVIVR